MAFFKKLLIQGALLVLVSLLLPQESSAQVGGILACTNFTCRYGECEQLDSRFICHCVPGVKGENCDRKMQPDDDLCLSSPCWGGGVCTNLGTDYRCDCPSGRSGKDCRTIESTACLYQNPCRNNAICRVTNGNVINCFCVGLWTGQYCETPISLCSRPTPCFNGGTCSNNACICPRNFTGFQCETYSPPNSDKVIKILNKGWYVADLRLNYLIQVGTEKVRVQQTGSIAANQDYAFYVPYSVNYDGATGVDLVVDAVWGIRVLATRITHNPECFHVWGTTLNPTWSRVNCW